MKTYILIYINLVLTYSLSFQLSGAFIERFLVDKELTTTIPSEPD